MRGLPRNALIGGMVVLIPKFDLDLLLDAIRKQHPFEADQVKRVTVRLAPTVAAVVDNRDIPDICLQHMMAVMLIDKTASFRAAHDKAREVGCNAVVTKPCLPKDLEQEVRRQLEAKTT